MALQGDVPVDILQCPAAILKTFPDSLLVMYSIQLLRFSDNNSGGLYVVPAALAIMVSSPPHPLALLS